MSDSGKFIVVFKDNVTKEQIDQYEKEVNSGGGEVGDRFDPILNGFSATLKPGQLQSFQANDVIKYIEADGPVSIQPVSKPE